MRYKILSLLMGCFILATSAIAQNAVCGFDQINQTLRKNSTYVEQVSQMEYKIQEKVQTITNQRRLFQNLNVLPGPVYEIPVVVHVIYKTGDDAIGSPSNPTLNQIQAALDRLNDNFAAAAGSGNIGASTPIKFTLAQRKQDCSATTGVERIDGGAVSGYNANGVSLPNSEAAGANESAIKDLSLWPAKAYYNIWVVWNVNANLGGSSFITGYATLPINTNDGSYHVFPKEGMVIRASQMTASSTTLTHEMGHAFGLYHTFEGGDKNTCPANTDCNTQGDKVCDTDPVKNLLDVFPYTLDSASNPCNSNQPYNGAQRNIMGYGGGLNQFTAGQSLRMIAAMEAVRGGLANSEATLPAPTTLVKQNTTQIPQNIVNTGNGWDEGPCNVTIGNLAYTSNGYSGDGHQFYLDNSCNIGTVLQTTAPVTLTVTTKKNLQRCKAWIDFNNNGQFENGEEILNSTSTSVEYSHIGTVTTGQLQGAEKNKLLRMRVMADWISSPDFGPGSQLEDGQTEDFWISVDGALPVLFSEVSATLRNNQLSVLWNTASEINNDHFLVQGSMDGKNFVTLAKYDSKAQNGNSDSSLNYKVEIGVNSTGLVLGAGVFAIFISLFGFRNRRKVVAMVAVLLMGIMFACNKYDAQVSNNPNSNVQYIRVAQVNKDGSTTYSKVVRVIAE